MKKLTFVALGLLSHAAVADPIEVAGLLSSRDEHALVVLTDKADGGVSPWLSEGKAWRGHKVVTIAMADDAVTLAKDGKSTTLRLRGSKVQAGESVGAGSIPLVKGEFTRVGDRITYSADAILQAGLFKITARSGRMEAEGAWVVGDLTVEAENGAKIPGGAVGMSGERVRIHAKKISLPAPPPTSDSKR